MQDATDFGEMIELHFYGTGEQSDMEGSTTATLRPPTAATVPVTAAQRYVIGPYRHDDPR